MHMGLHGYVWWPAFAHIMLTPAFTADTYPGRVTTSTLQMEMNYVLNT